MKNNNTDEIAIDLRDQLSSKYDDIKDLYVFGSRVTGNFNEHSDLDFLALFDEVNGQKKMDIYGIISDLMYKYDVYIDLKMMTSEEFCRNPLFLKEVEKGKKYGIL